MGFSVFHLRGRGHTSRRSVHSAIQKVRPRRSAASLLIPLESSVKNADQLERKAEIVWMKYSILQESGVLNFAFLRFWILLLDDS